MKKNNPLYLIRIKHKLKQSEMAKMTGISQATISKVENGKVVDPNINFLYKIKKAFDVDMNVFIKEFMVNLGKEK